MSNVIALLLNLAVLRSKRSFNARPSPPPQKIAAPAASTVFRTQKKIEPYYYCMYCIGKILH
jgi:hypothetical protein